MKKAKLFSAGFLFVGFLNGFSQTVFPSVIDCGAKYASMEYNTGEVYVVFNILGNTIISKNTDNVNDDSLSYHSNNEISVYPNPVTDILRIVTRKGERVTKLILSDMEGRVILNQDVLNNQIDLSSLPVGTYILKTDLSSTETFKIIKR